MHLKHNGTPLFLEILLIVNYVRDQGKFDKRGRS
jgi:hypothetical protein